MSKKGSVPTGRIETAVPPRAGIFQDKAPMPFINPVMVNPQPSQPLATQPPATQPTSPTVAPTKSGLAH